MNTTTTLGEELRRRRGERSLQEVSSQAKISTAYLHKLENGRVRNPSPRVLERLAGVLEVPYWTLMDLAGYVPAGQAGPPRRAGRKETTVSHRSATESPTNAEIVRLLREITAQLARLEDNQDGLARLLEKAESPQ